MLDWELVLAAGLAVLGWALEEMVGELAAGLVVLAEMALEALGWERVLEEGARVLV